MCQKKRIRGEKGRESVTVDEARRMKEVKKRKVIIIFFFAVGLSATF